MESALKGAGETTTMDVSAKKLVSTKAFGLLAGSGKTLSFVADDYAWSFAAADITDPDAIPGTAFDTFVTGESSLAAAMRAAANDEDLIPLHFNYSGKLPGTAEIRVRVEAEAGEMYLYSYADGSFTALGTATVDADGFAVFKTDAVGELALTTVPIVTETAPEDAPAQEPDAPADSTQDVPADVPTDVPADAQPETTGNRKAAIIAVIVAAVAAVSVGGVCVLRKGKKAH